MKMASDRSQAMAQPAERRLRPQAINFFGYFPQGDGYGRFSSRMVQALQRAGVDVRALHIGELDRPGWLLDQLQIDWSRLTITCAPPFMLRPVPGPHWLFSMVESSELPDGWADTINSSGVERVLVPCQHNAEAFARSGVTVPISVVPGGTDPAEFPVILDRPERPYTFLTIADRGARKGWLEVWDAFYRAFGGKTTGVQDVRLIIKNRPKSGNVTDVVIEHGADLDARIVWQAEDFDDMAAVYAQTDCVVLPSRSEGWGMPHREAAMCGLPVIVQAYAGLDDGHTCEWAIAVEGGRIAQIPQDEPGGSRGEWMIADVGALAATMRSCYEQPDAMLQVGLRAAQWLRQNQTWDMAAATLLELIEQETRPVAAETGELNHA